MPEYGDVVHVDVGAQVVLNFGSHTAPAPTTGASAAAAGGEASPSSRMSAIRARAGATGGTGSSCSCVMWLRARAFKMIPLRPRPASAGSGEGERRTVLTSTRTQLAYDARVMSPRVNPTSESSRRSVRVRSRVPQTHSGTGTQPEAKSHPQQRGVEQVASSRWPQATARSPLRGRGGAYTTVDITSRAAPAGGHMC